MKLRSIENLDLSGRKVIVRLDLNAPLEGGEVSDDTRITAAIPTVRHLMNAGAKVVLCSHLGRPKGKPEAKYSLKPVGQRLAELSGYEVMLVENYDDNLVSATTVKLLRKEAGFQKYLTVSKRLDWMHKPNISPRSWWESRSSCVRPRLQRDLVIHSRSQLCGAMKMVLS